MPVKRSYSKDELPLLISRGDERAFGNFYHQTGPGVYNTAMIYLKDERAAREIVRAVFIEIWDQRHLLKEVRSLNSYLFVLAKNTVFDHLKKGILEGRHLERERRRAPVSNNHGPHHEQKKDVSRLFYHQNVT